MFQLIIAVISIALVALLVAAAIWMGGVAFNSSGERALFTTYMNQGAQIEGSLKMYKADHGVMPVATGTTLADKSESLLTTLESEKYLSSRPPGAWLIGEGGDTIYKPLEDIQQCKRLNQFMNMDFAALAAFEGVAVDDEAFTGCPPCSVPPEDPDYAAVQEFKSWPGCKEA